MFILETAMEFRIPLPKKRGRPQFTWRTCIRQDIHRTGTPPDHWQELALDKSKFKAASKRLYSTMVESEYEESESEQEEESDGDLIPSDFDGFSGDSDTFFEGY